MDSAYGQSSSAGARASRRGGSGWITAIVVMGTVLDVPAFGAFAWFCVGIIRTGRVFARMRAFQLCIVGIGLGVHALIGAFMPALREVSDPVSGGITYISSGIDFRMFFAAFLFIALALVFECGRQLQDDVESFV